MKGTAQEFIRFVIAGCINTSSTYAVYLIAERYVHYFAAYTLAYIVGIFLSYLLSVCYVFPGRHSVARLVRFPAVYVLQYVGGAAALYLLVDRWGVRQDLAMLAVTVAGVTLTFLFTKRLFSSRGSGGGVRPTRN